MNPVRGIRRASRVQGFSGAERPAPAAGLPLRGAERPDGRAGRADGGLALEQPVGLAQGTAGVEGLAERLAGSSFEALGGNGQPADEQEGPGIAANMHPARPTLWPRPLADEHGRQARPVAHQAFEGMTQEGNGR